MTAATTLRSGDALIIVDVQNDFLPGGVLAVRQGDEIIPVLNDYAKRFSRHRLPVFITREWHPSNHCEFNQQWWRWPPHCVMATPGAEFPASLVIPEGATVISKGTNPQREGYSGFTETKLEEDLRQAGVRRLFIGGLGLEFCVLNTVRDAISRGFEVVLLRDAVRATDIASAAYLAKIEDEIRHLGVISLTLEGLCPGARDESALLTDLYQLTMLRGYQAAKMEDVAVFEFFVRQLPSQWNFLIAAGLEQVLELLEDFRFTPSELEWLQREGGFDPEFIRQLAGLRFTGDVHAMPEGTIFFPDEPILRVTAPIAQAQAIETRLVNLLHFETLMASKAVRSVLAAPDKALVDFGARRAHGADAAVLAARACYLAGFASTSDVRAGEEFGIPIAGTMAHSFVEACDTEEEAFLRFARANPHQVVLVLDTYDTEAAARKVVTVAAILRAEGIAVKGVRLDSGDLGEHARHVRQILDEGGLREATIFASGNLDEHELRRLAAAKAPIDGYGMGSRITTSADASSLDCAYALQEYGGAARCKRSEGKSTWPGAKQVYRHFDHTGPMAFDVIATAGETRLGLPLLECVMRHGRRTGVSPSLQESARRVKAQLSGLPVSMQSLEKAGEYPVVKSQALQALARKMGVGLISRGSGPRSDPVGHHHLGFLGRIHADAMPTCDQESDCDDHVMI